MDNESFIYKNHFAKLERGRWIVYAFGQACKMVMIGQHRKRSSAVRQIESLVEFNKNTATV